MTIAWSKRERLGAGRLRPMLARFSGDDGALALRRRLFAALLIAVLAAGVAAFAWWYLAAGSVSTDDAYVGANIAQITPQIGGTVKTVTVGDTDRVKRGDVLVVLDDADSQLALSRAEADYARAIQHVSQYGANVDAAAAEVAMQQAEFARSQADYDRRSRLAAAGAISREELSTAAAAYKHARGGLDAAQASLAAAQALVKGLNVASNPEVLSAKAALDTARLNLARTLIRAPVDGIVARRQVQIGQHVDPGALLMTVVPLAEVYVDANFKEGQLKRVRPGQPAILVSDLYGSDVVFHGRVVGLGGGTGSAFAIIPAQNATGNWIKIVQRIPVRIALNPRELKQHPLRIGLSMTATIDVR